MVRRTGLEQAFAKRPRARAARGDRRTRRHVKEHAPAARPVRAHQPVQVDDGRAMDPDEALWVERGFELHQPGRDEAGRPVGGHDLGIIVRARDGDDVAGGKRLRALAVAQKQGSGFRPARSSTTTSPTAGGLISSAVHAASAA